MQKREKLMKNLIAVIAFIPMAAGLASAAQSAAGGSVEGSVTDPTGAGIPGASASILNRITNYHQTAETDQNGHFHIGNVPPNTYHVEIGASGFSTAQQDISVRSTVPVALNVRLELAGSSTSVTVEDSGSDMLETVTYAHNDLGENALAKLPMSSPGAGLSDAITLAAPGVVADSNGFFHPLGDHAQTSFSIDGQPIGDQQSKQFSTQIPANALQSMELITGAPPAEFGDKTSLVVNAVTHSGLGQKLNGSFLAEAGSFGSYSEQASLAAAARSWEIFWCST
jgi:carboxypeptidase family protein